MCGIAGIGHVSEGQWPRALDSLGQLLGKLRKRGPDGLVLYSEPGFALAQTVLLITDPTSGITPYLSEDRNIIAVVNGEIYNHNELREELRSNSFQFASNSDCEIVANGYAAHGTAFLRRIRGMFTIALLNRSRRTLILARDPFGIRQLYYSRDQGHVAFCSEPRPLVTSGLASSEPDKEAQFEAMVVRQPIEPKTMYRGIQALLPGHCIEFSDQAQREWRFAADPFAPRSSVTLPVSAPREERTIRQAVRSAIEMRVPSSCRYSTFLSGGLDSGIVAATVARKDPLRLPSVVCGFQGSDVLDERRPARRLAQHLRLPLHETTLTASTFLALWPYLLSSLGAPLMFNSTLPIHWMCRQLRAAGAKVVLSGEGGDEIFLGYRHYATYSGQVDDGSPDYLLLHDAEFHHPLADLGLRWKHDSPAAAHWDSLRERIQSLAPVLKGQTGLDRKLRLDRILFLRALLVRQDRAGLGCGVEIRVPYLDDRVVSLAGAVPNNEHLSTTQDKRVLRRLFATKLGAFAATSKVGFPLPLADWLSAPEARPLLRLLASSLPESGLLPRDELEKTLRRARSHPRQSTTVLWTQLNLAAWTLLQSAGHRFFSLWRDQLDPVGRALMDELEHEQRPEPPGWLLPLMARCADRKQASIYVSSKWQEPVEFESPHRMSSLAAMAKSEMIPHAPDMNSARE